jgi:hypothetical protein
MTSQLQRIGGHASFERLQELLRGAEKAVCWNESFDPRVGALKVIVVNEMTDPLAGVCEILEDGRFHQFPPHGAPEAFDLPQGQSRQLHPF